MQNPKNIQSIWKRSDYAFFQLLRTTTFCCVPSSWSVGSLGDALLLTVRKALFWIAKEAAELLIVRVEPPGKGLEFVAFLLLT